MEFFDGWQILIIRIIRFDLLVTIYNNTSILQQSRLPQHKASHLTEHITSLQQTALVVERHWVFTTDVEYIDVISPVQRYARVEMMVRHVPVVRPPCRVAEAVHTDHLKMVLHMN